YHVIILTNGAVAAKIQQHRRQKLRRQTVGIFLIAIAPQTFDRYQLQRRPAVREIPLASTLLHTSHQPTTPLERRKVPSDRLSLLTTGETHPQRVESGSVFVRGLFVPGKIVVEKLPSLRAPQILIESAAPRLRAVMPPE